MNKRLIIKTSLICTGVFIILAALAVLYVTTNYRIESGRQYSVLAAVKDIAAGDILTEANTGIRTVTESEITPNMMTDPSQCIGSKMLSPIRSGEYVLSYNLLSPSSWNRDDDRIIILPMNVEERLANRICKGSLIDIKVLPENQKTIPQTVLSHITVEDILDENGMSAGDALGSKKAYAIVMLDSKQRDRFYSAQQIGKIIYELYCNSIQPEAGEDFVIPPEFYIKETSTPEEVSKIPADNNNNPAEKTTTSQEVTN